MKISIVIPTYEMNGYGAEYLSHCIDSIANQSFKEYEVIVSDHSLDMDVKNLCSEIPSIIYVRNDRARGSSSANLNNAIQFATGDIIKPIFQDDYFHSDQALQIIHDAFIKKAKWVVCGSNVSVDHTTILYDFIPTWNPDIVFGRNTLSSPSCLAYLKCGLTWDERLLWLMDCNFYHRLFKKFGLPYLEKRILVTNFGHANQVTKLLPNERKQMEVDLMRQEYAS
jgi:glycosyltransferase involved in cell wall biosynthesis